MKKISYPSIDFAYCTYFKTYYLKEAHSKINYSNLLLTLTNLFFQMPKETAL